MDKLIKFIVRYLVAFIGSVYLFVFGFLKGSNRGLIYQIAHHFSGMDPDPNKPKPDIPVIQLSELFGEEPGIQLREVDVADGNVTPLELIVINQLVVKYSPTRLFEIGTFDGRTTLNLAVNTSSDARIFTLDLPKTNLSQAALRIEEGEKLYVEKETSGARFAGKPCSSKIVQLYGDSGTFDFSPYEDSIDLVFVDASHSFDYVINDSHIALRLLRKRQGIILWHDFNAWPGVTLALNELSRTCSEFKGVKHIAGTTLAYARFG